MKVNWKMKFGIILSFILTFFLTSIDYPIDAETEEGEKVYKIAIGQNYMPFNFQGDDGNLTGIDVEIFKAIAEDQGFEYEVQSYQLNGLLQALESGQADAGLAALSVTDERKESMDFSDPYYESGTIFAVPGDSDIETLEDLEGKTVAVKIGSTGAQIAESLKDEFGYEINPFDESANMYEDVAAGHSQALIEDNAVISYAINTGAHDLKLIGEEQSVASLALAVSKGQNQAFLQMFNDGLENIKASGTYDQIIESFLGEEGLDKASIEEGFFAQLINYAPDLLSGLWNTIKLSLVSIAIAFVLGIVLGFMRVFPNKFLNKISQFYVDLMRGIPMMVLAFFIYFSIPQMTGIQMSAPIAGMLTLSLNATAYIGEIIRGGIVAVEDGQIEAGRSLGLSYGHTMFYVVFPQAMKITIPSLINQFVITLKDTSILSVIGLVELTQTGRMIIARTYESGYMWLIIALMYFTLITSLTRLSQYIERKMEYGKDNVKESEESVRISRSLEIN